MGILFLRGISEGTCTFRWNKNFIFTLNCIVLLIYDA